ncbi:DUF3130 family protein [Listeria ilorinensis]|uniref:DUF3130 family protein n=1 Tax=Listeria ilorinensis TaxID=2867439 RepID=UPI001EF4C001|nr:DUF3130 family protein [Listeria ilorinensis]
MSEVKVKESTMLNHASKVGESVSELSYLPFKNGNIQNSHANSIDYFREGTAMFIEAFDGLGRMVQEDAQRIKKLGIAYSDKDRELEKKVGLEVK